MQRERLYRAGPGRYVAVEDVEPQQSDDIPLRRGMEVEGTLEYNNITIRVLSGDGLTARHRSLPLVYSHA